MRLSEVLSREPSNEFTQIEGFLDNKKLKFGKQRKIKIGKVALNYRCLTCSDQRTFWSEDEMYCLGVDNNTVSIDLNLRCNCGTDIQMWFLLESENEISSYAPNIKILKKSERLGNKASKNLLAYGEQSINLVKADHAFREKLGAGSMVYLRIIYESVTKEVANNIGIPTTTDKGKKINFAKILEDVDKEQKIIPTEFSANKYNLFGTLSEIIHGNSNEELALSKYESSRRLIVGILDNIKGNEEINKAVMNFGFPDSNKR